MPAMENRPSAPAASSKEEITNAFGYPLTPETSHASTLGRAAVSPSSHRSSDTDSAGSDGSLGSPSLSAMNPLRDALQRLLKLENDQGNWDEWGTTSRERHWWSSTQGNSQLFEAENEDDGSLISGPLTAVPLTPPATPVRSSIGDDGGTALLMPDLERTLVSLVLNEEQQVMESQQVIPVPTSASTPGPGTTANERRIVPLSPISPGRKVFSLKRPGSVESQASFAMRSSDGTSLRGLERGENQDGTSTVPRGAPMRPKFRSRKSSVSRAMNFLKSLRGTREGKDGESSVSFDDKTI